MCRVERCVLDRWKLGDVSGWGLTRPCSTWNGASGRSGGRCAWGYVGERGCGAPPGAGRRRCFVPSCDRAVGVIDAGVLAQAEPEAPPSGHSEDASGPPRRYADRVAKPSGGATGTQRPERCVDRVARPSGAATGAKRPGTCADRIARPSGGGTGQAAAGGVQARVGKLARSDAG